MDIISLIKFELVFFNKSPKFNTWLSSYQVQNPTLGQQVA